MTVVLPFKLKVPGKDEFQGADITSVSYRFHGLLRLDGTDLHIEWAGTAHVDEVGTLNVRSETLPLPSETLDLPVSRLATVEVRGGWLRPRLEITATDLAALAVVPGEAQGRVRFWIARSHREQAAALVEALHRARDAVLADGAG
jgi:hypothetical protein